MKVLYISLVNYDKQNTAGVRGKIVGQIKAINAAGVDCCSVFVRNSGMYYSNGIEEIILKSSIVSKLEPIEKRIIYYKTLLNLIKKENFDTVYIRYPLSDPFFLVFLKECKKMGLKILLEIATYPYDKELGKILYHIDKHYRKKLNKYVDKIITYSKDKEIYGINTICIHNGINLESIKPTNRKKKKEELNLIGVASLVDWQGFDRVIEGLRAYYNKTPNPKTIVRFIIIGDGKAKVKLEELTNQYHLNEYVIFKGFKSGKELDLEFDSADIGVSSIGVHRKGIYEISPLKSSEYWGRGLPLLKSYKDVVVDDVIPEYCLTIEPDDTPVNIDKLIEFNNKLVDESDVSQKLIGLARQHITWDAQLEQVISMMKDNCSTKTKD